MKICKEAEARGVGQPTPEDLGLINALARRELGAEEVYTFALRLCDNDIDRDFERFDDAALDQLAQLFVGVSGVFDHQWTAKGQAARIYRAQVVAEDSVTTADGRPYRYLKGWAYMMRTPDNESLIAEIDGGIKREVSVGCSMKQVLCSLCGQPLAQCPHEKGEEYDGQLCCGVLTGAADAYEWSFVAVPAQRKAGVMKTAAQRTQEEARLGRSYLKGLRRELVRLCGLAQPQLDHDLLVKVAGKLEEPELVGLIKAFRPLSDKALGIGPQLSYDFQGEPPAESHGAFLI